ncbi:TauD/TfdA dioxygenase family protein [Actinomadura rayongensis]|uniref:TauD/TfdA family dioxygenase n=1 Tax=Actinomadura rayongensis TaxID=1429076 RepID=A0A6I4W9I9_9ACTN|nr:TauD/TfdA family dioxygenase [Actinomadura rayongensis]MXQ63734.1 TauD/TfdA family dioxygenase [Actinomadura rayongensis]
MTSPVLDPVRRTRSPRIKPVAGLIGAEVCRLRLAGRHDRATVAVLRDALLRHRVLFFRGQDDLDEAGLTAFAALLGTPETIADAEPGGTAFHTEESYASRPPKAVVLHALDVPAHGGDTVWANTVAAYDALPAELRDVADRLWARHARGGREAEHPLVRVHPATGERSLLLGGFARAIAGLSAEADSEALIRLFQDQVVRLENTVRWRWAPGDVALADNRATQVRVVRDFGDAPRRLRRITLAGETPGPVRARPPRR